MMTITVVLMMIMVKLLMRIIRNKCYYISRMDNKIYMIQRALISSQIWNLENGMSEISLGNFLCTVSMCFV